MRLVDNWKGLWRSMTVQISALGLAVTQLLYLIPTWDMVPDEVKAAIPPEHLPYVTSFFFIATIVARAKYQASLHVDKKEEEE